MKLLSPAKFSLKMVWRASRKWLIFNLTCSIFLALTSVVNTYTFKLVIDAVSGSKVIFGLSLVAILGIRLGYDVLKKTIEGVVGYTWQKLDISQVIYMHRAFVDKVSTLDLATFENPYTVGLIQRAYSRLQYQFKLYVNSMVQLAASMVELLAAITIFFFASPVFASIVLVANLVPIWVRSKHSYGVFMIYRADDETRRQFGYTSDIITDRSTLPEVKVNQAFNFFKDRLTRIYQKFTGNQIKLEGKFQLYNTLAEMFPIGAIFGFSLYLAHQVSIGLMTPGTFIFLFTNVFTFSGALTRLSQQLGFINQDSHFIDEIREIFELKPQVTYPVVTALKQTDIGECLQHPTITFDHVSFAYASQPDRLVLSDINFSIPYGQNVALIGENGAGKTTLVKLLLRIYDPTDGNIYINGINLKDIPETTLYSMYSTLFQSFGKFCLTVAENLTLSAGKKMSQEEMVDALKFANAWEFVETAKKGLDTQLGPEYKDGIDLSGGQWQRLAIARAYVKKAPILILDEPTSAVDAKSETEIFDRINSKMKDNTLIFISHRFSTIKDAERIIVLDKGKVIQDGTHRHLMNQNGKYAELYLTQAERYQR